MPPAAPMQRPVTPPQQKNGEKEKPTIKSLLLQSRKQLAEAAGDALDPDKLLRIATGSMLKNPKLGECDPMSFLGAVIQCAQWGVYPGTDSLAKAYLIPRFNKQTGNLECNAMLSYQGLVLQVQRASRDLVMVEAHPVYADELEGPTPRWRLVRGFRSSFTYEPIFRDRTGELPVLLYAQATFYNSKGEMAGTPYVEVMTWAAVMRRKAVGAGGDAWKAWPEEMARKTVVRAIIKYLPTTPDLDERLAADSDEGETVDGEVSNRAAVSAAPARRQNQLQAESMRETLEFSPRPAEDFQPVDVAPAEEAAPAQATVAPVQQSMDLPDEEAEAAAAVERLRLADAAAKAAAATPLPPVSDAPLPPRYRAINFADADAKAQLMAKLEDIYADQSMMLDTLTKAFKQVDRLPTEQHVEVGNLYQKLRARMVATARKG